MRLDLFISRKFKISRSFSINLIKNNRILVNNLVENSPKKNVLTEDKINIISINNSIKILFESEDFLIIHKPYNLSVCRSNTTPKIEQVLNEEILKKYSLAMNTKKPHEFGLVNRLDKETEGIMIIAKK